MRFVLDESADFPLAKYLADLGHDVKAIARDYPQALKDIEVPVIAQQEERILITNDTDFGELIFRRRLSHAGVVLFRLGSESVAAKILWLGYVLARHAEQLDQFIVITERGVRVRRTQ